MLRHPEFSLDEWEKAPVYHGPGTKELQSRGGLISLDFTALEMLASTQEDAGAFRSSNGLEASKAPIKLGDTAAAFIRVSSMNTDDYLVHNPTSAEVLVIINGILTLKNSRFAQILRAHSGQTGPLEPGDVLSLEPEAVRLKAHGLNTQATSLALAIKDIEPRQRGLIIMQEGFKGIKQVEPEGRVNLPYENN